MRQPQLKCERLTAEDFIKELTHKHHDMSSFTTTVSRGTDTQVNFTVHGFFKEIKNCQESVKIFWRVVQLVPTMDGRPSVASERMFIREALASEMPPAFASTTSATSSSCPFTALTSSQQELVNSFAEKPHMTPKWSQRCLERNNWDFSKAADDFIHLYVSTVPPTILTDTRTLAGGGSGATIGGPARTPADGHGEMATSSGPAVTFRGAYVPFLVLSPLMGVWEQRFY
ncbi:unnamed protein product [Lampetra fluviatilis]